MSRFLIVQADNSVSTICAKILSENDTGTDVTVYKNKFFNNFDTGVIEQGDQIIAIGYSYTGSDAQNKKIDEIDNSKCDDFMFLALYGKQTDNPEINVIDNYATLIGICLTSVNSEFKYKDTLEGLHKLSCNKEVAINKSLSSILGCLEYTKLTGNNYRTVPLSRDADGLFEVGRIDDYLVSDWYYDTKIKPNMNKQLYEFGKSIPNIDSKVFVLNSDIDLSVFKIVKLQDLKGIYDIIIQPKGFNVSRDNVLVLVIPLNKQVSGTIKDDNKFATDILNGLGFVNSKVGQYTGYTIMPVSFTGLFS